jgi:A/G-specific DNA glycosylase
MQIKIDPRALIYWYNNNKRLLPFRLTKDPYKIWISETMLQQTQIKTVVPFYERWVNKLPTIESVATTNINSLLKLWGGIGIL